MEGKDYLLISLFILGTNNLYLQNVLFFFVFFREKMKFTFLRLTFLSTDEHTIRIKNKTV